MNALKLAAAASVFAFSISSAQAFEWSSYLQQSPADLQTALGSSATCREMGYSVPVEFIDAETKVRADLVDPVVNTSSKRFWIDPSDISVDRDERRRFAVENIKTMECLIGREATATAYSADGQIFRIALQYDRCQERKEQTHFLYDMKYSPCRGADINEKPFDTALYDEIVAISHGYEDDYSWLPFRDGEYTAKEQSLIVALECHGTVELTRWLRSSKDANRCLIAIDNSDIAHWSATTMYEIYEDGYFSDTVKARLTASRLFVDLPAEHQAAEDMLPGLQAMIDGIKAEIADRIAEKAAKDGAVSDLLGAGN